MPQAYFDVHFSSASLKFVPFEIERQSLSFSSASSVALRCDLLPLSVEGLTSPAYGLIAKDSAGVVPARLDIVHTSALNSFAFIPKFLNSH